MSPNSHVPSTLPTPVVSPKAKIADPFFDDLGAVAVGASNSANPTITGLAAYLTTLSNDQVFRQAHPWKLFVRVRTDDLESVRIERAIRRLRSDIAAHISSPSMVNVTMHNSSVLHDAKRAGTEAEMTHEQDDSFTQDTGPFPSLDNSERVPSPVLDDTTSSSDPSRSVIEIEASDNFAILSDDTLEFFKGFLSRNRYSEADYNGEEEEEVVAHAAKRARERDEAISEPETHKQRPATLPPSKTLAQRSNVSHKSKLLSVNHRDDLAFLTDTSQESGVSKPNLALTHRNNTSII